MSEITLHPITAEDESIHDDTAMLCSCGCPVFYYFENGAVECVSCGDKGNPNNFKRWLN